MVLQRMQYDVINGEEEDVTPVDGSISKAASRPAKVRLLYYYHYYYHELMMIIL